jgi:hypothetical protein
LRKKGETMEGRESKAATSSVLLTKEQLGEFLMQNRHMSEELEQRNYILTYSSIMPLTHPCPSLAVVRCNAMNSAAERHLSQT